MIECPQQKIVCDCLSVRSEDSRRFCSENDRERKSKKYQRFAAMESTCFFDAHSMPNEPMLRVVYYI